MVNQALDWLAIQPGERVLDLFCGVGNFSLPLARAGALVTGVEGSAEMVERAAANARLNGLGQTHFYQADFSNSLDSAGCIRTTMRRCWIRPETVRHRWPACWRRKG